jgi:hypothetical protein
MITGGADPSLRNAMGLVAADLASNMRLRELLLGYDSVLSLSCVGVDRVNVRHDSEELVEVLFRFPREKVPALIGRQVAPSYALHALVIGVCACAGRQVAGTAAANGHGALPAVQARGARELCHRTLDVSLLQATPIVEISCKGTPAGLEMVKDRLLQMLVSECLMVRVVA